MNAIKQVRKYLLRYPGTVESAVLGRLTAAIAEETSFPLHDLYEIDGEAFELAMQLLQDWRLDRYYAARIKLFDVVLNDTPRHLDSPSASPGVAAAANMR